jgi:DNA-binding response OmpR family regulator
MIANPLYGRHPEADAEQLRAIRLLPRGEWRGPGCGDRCVRVLAELMGGGGREIIEAHDPAAHEAYVHALYVPKIVRTGCLTVDIGARRFWVDRCEVVRYPPQTLAVVLALAERVGTVVTKDELWEAMHGATVPRTHAESYWSTLMHRTRLALGSARGVLEMRLNVGYMLRAEEP